MPHRLNYEQFFHVSPSENRESIERHGMDRRRGAAQWEETDAESGDYPGNYLFHSDRDARIHARNMASASGEGTPNYLGTASKFDLYEVNVPRHLRGRVLREDPLLQDASVSDQPIPRSWIRRRESIGPWGEEF